VNAVRSLWAKTTASIVGLFCLTLLYFSDVLTAKTLLVERDLTTFFYPFRFVWVETIRQGHFPFWNPYIKCGVPLFATIQPAVLYPLSLFYLLLPLDLAFNWTIVLHFFLAGLFTYGLMRELGASLQGALAVAIGFVFSGYLISVHNVLNTLISVSWYPLVMWFGCRMVRTGMVRWAIAAGISICCMFLGGGVEAVLFAVVSLLILSIQPAVLPATYSDNSVSLQRRLGLFGVAVIIFLGLSMVQLVPFFEVYRQSHRYSGVPLYEATRWSLAPRDLLYFLLPDIYGERLSPDRYWKFQNYLKSIYVGPIVLLLACICLVKKGRRGLILLAAMTVTLILALGEYTPIYPFFYRYLPLFAALRYPVKFIFLFIFWLCVAAGLGLDLLRSRFSERRRPPPVLQKLLVVSIFVMAGLLIISRFFPGQVLRFAQQLSWISLDPEYLPLTLHNLNRLLVFTVLASMVIFFGLRHKLFRFGTPFLLLLLTIDLFLGNRGYAIKLESTSFHAETDIVRTLKADNELFRFHVLAEVRELNVPVKSYGDYHRLRKEFLGYDLMMEHHLFDIDGYNVPLQPRYEAFINMIRGRPVGPIQSLLNMLNVKYVLSAEPIDLPGFVHLRDGLGESKLYENRNSLPRAFLVQNYQVMEKGEEFAIVFDDPNFDPQSTILLEQEPAGFLELEKQPAMPQLKSMVKLVTYENNRMVLEVNTPEAAFLFMSESYYPGWIAYVDGKKKEILRANYVFRVVPLGPGSHRVEMVYEPLSFKIGLSVTMLTIFLLLIGWGLAIRLRRGR
jgi:hypothetical protein